MKQKYGIDKIEFTSLDPPVILQAQREKFTVPEDIGKVQILNPKEKNNDVSLKDLPNSHQSLVRLTSDDMPRLLKFLLSQKHFLSMGLVPYSIEIYRDTFFSTNPEAIKHTRQKQFYTAFKNARDIKPRLFFNDGFKDPRPDCLDDRSLYMTVKEALLNFVIYCRLSKTDNSPCCREEFRLKGYRLIKNLNLSTDENRLKFNLEKLLCVQSYKDNFDTLYREHVFLCMINFQKVWNLLDPKFEKNGRERKKSYGKLYRAHLKSLRINAKWVNYLSNLTCQKARYFDVIFALS